MTSGRLPDFVMLGAMRSGSTSLYRYIGAHPDVFVAPKELQFFTERFDNGLEWYMAQFAVADPDAALGEATADYLARESAMTRIAAVLPEAGMVASLRNPVDRAFSHHGLLTARGRETRSFSEAVAEEIDAVDRHGHSAEGVIYLSHSLYDVHLSRLFGLFPRKQVFITIFERTVADPRPDYAALCRFIGVDDGFVPDNLGKQVNPYVTFRSLRLRETSRSLPDPLRRIVARLNTKRSGQAPPADPATTASLVDFFAPHIETVRGMLDDPLAEWD